jgi:SAM-dependent methyltransferase
VLALERSPAYVAAGRALAIEAGLPQLELREHDLLRDPLPVEGFDLAWMRWVAMFLGDLEPLLTQLPLALRPGGRLVVHEYVHWDTFGLHPDGRAIARFGQAVQQSFRAAGGDPDVNQRLPSLLAARAWRIEALTPLPVLGGDGSMAAQWMQRFVAVYATQLMAQGLWSASDQAEAEAEMAAAQADPGSYWVGPTVLELRATR